MVEGGFIPYDSRLHTIEGFNLNNKRIDSIYKALALKLNIKLGKPYARDKPDTLVTVLA